MHSHTYCTRPVLWENTSIFVHTPHHTNGNRCVYADRQTERQTAKERQRGGESERERERKKEEKQSTNKSKKTTKKTLLIIHLCTSVYMNVCPCISEYTHGHWMSTQIYTHKQGKHLYRQEVFGNNQIHYVIHIQKSGIKQNCNNHPKQSLL